MLKVKVHLSNQYKFKQGRISLLHTVGTQHMPLIGLMNSCCEKHTDSLHTVSLQELGMGSPVSQS